MIVSAAFSDITETTIRVEYEDGLHTHIGADYPADNPVVRALADWGGVVSAYEPISPPILTRLPKADLWRRLTDDEGEAVNVVLLAVPIRLRRLYEAATYIDTADDDYPALQAGVEAALGAERAAEVLAPNL